MLETQKVSPSKELQQHALKLKQTALPTAEQFAAQFGRPVPRNSSTIAPFLEEAGRLRSFLPPFSFTSFFSPEDTLLCACASEAALSHARSPWNHDDNTREPMRIVELTTGSGLVGLHLLMLESGSILRGLDIDTEAVRTATTNAGKLGLSERASFHSADIWSDATAGILDGYAPHLMICNPPYIPEPPGNKLEIEAGSGPDGTAHLLRTLELAAEVKPRSLALSWCSLSNPEAVVRSAAAAGYSLDSLFITVIADGEYSGSVHGYLKDLPHAHINEQPGTVNIVAPDGSGRFAYLLMAGNFSLVPDTANNEAAADVERICVNFAARGIESLETISASVAVRTWILDRWDELVLRASLHGRIEIEDRIAHGMADRIEDPVPA